MPFSGEDTMNKLSSEKQKQLALVALVTVVAIAGVGYGLIKPEYQRRDKLAQAKQAATQKVEQMKQSIENADQIDAQLCDTKKRLEKIEEGMASGDLYSWAINTIRQFKLSYRVDIPQFSQIDGPRDMSMLPGFPYKQATLTVGGTATYNDFGKFVSDFENKFPYARLVNLTLEPVAGVGSTDREKLAFKMQITALVKPGAS
jgi:Tfp pilus assembly protein PilO